jgi:hypothetical protein
VGWSWGDQASSELVPRVSLETTERRDPSAVMTAVGSPMRSGYMDPSQLAETDRLIGLTVQDLSPTRYEEREPAGPEGAPERARQSG